MKSKDIVVEGRAYEWGGGLGSTSNVLGMKRMGPDATTCLPEHSWGEKMVPQGRKRTNLASKSLKRNQEKKGSAQGGSPFYNHKLCQCGVQRGGVNEINPQFVYGARKGRATIQRGGNLVGGKFGLVRN